MTHKTRLPITVTFAYCTKSRIICANYNATPLCRLSIIVLGILVSKERVFVKRDVKSSLLSIGATARRENAMRVDARD